MTLINIITAICVALFTAAALYVVIGFAVKKRGERIMFLRNFKKGKCLAVFLIAIPLFVMGHGYAGASPFEAFLLGVTQVVELVVLKYNVSKVSALMGANMFYRFAVYYCCALVTVNAVLFALSLADQAVWRFMRRLVMKFTKKDRLYIFGNNENSRAVYNSGKKYCAVVIDKLQPADTLSLFMQKIAYMDCPDFMPVAQKIFASAKKKNKTVVVVNTDNDETNLAIGRMFVQMIGEADERTKLELFGKLSVYMFGDPKYTAIYDDIASSSFGCVQYKNKYQMIAMNFIDKYPLTEFMDERHIDYSTACVKRDVDINVCIMGFGKAGRQIFLTSVANNQFITEGASDPELKPVNYYLFDRNDVRSNKNLNHSYYRMENECADVDKDEYLPLPSAPANVKFNKLNIDDPAFYNRIRDVVTAKNTDLDVVVISFKDDLENIDMAQKFIEKRREWGNDDVIVFVKLRKKHGVHDLFKEKNVYIIGDELDEVYNIDRITDDKISRMAKMRNEIYDIEYKITHDKTFVPDEKSVAAARAESNYAWYVVKSRLERDSSLFGCLSLRSKLNMMGLDYASDGDGRKGLSEEEYMSRYASSDMPNTAFYNMCVDGKRIIKYSTEFERSLRYNFAVHEHLRWNSFMISRGMIPASKDAILNETVEKNGKLRHTNGKNYRLRRHGNITTFAGLIEFRKMIAARDGVSEEDCDVIKYDYQLLDDAYWLLAENGFNIVEKRAAQ